MQMKCVSGRCSLLDGIGVVMADQGGVAKNAQRFPEGTLRHL